MTLKTENYMAQKQRWPQTGRHILAQFDDTNVVVYQAYCPSIANFAVQYQRLGGDFSFGRMSWIKTNFLWMMYRCGWATKENQERVLAITIPRPGFDQLLAQAVPASFDAARFRSDTEWKKAVAQSSVRLQWDPDHSPSGGTVERRAIQLGMRGDVLRSFATDWIVRIEDMTTFVHEQAAFVYTGDLSQLVTPREDCYPASETTARQLGTDVDRLSDFDCRFTISLSRGDTIEVVIQMYRFPRFPKLLLLTYGLGLTLAVAAPSGR